jgi:hypothetical protein
MPDPELTERVRALRERGRSPKEIARALKLPPATIAPLVRAIAAQTAPENPALVLARCWVSAGWSSGLTIHGQPDWPGADAPRDFDELAPSGLVTVLVAAERGGSKVSVCGYLVDVYCLGVKNALGPRGLDRRKLPEFVHQYFQTHDELPVPAPLDLARHLVFGAVAYAGDLGFEPHSDFAAAAAITARFRDDTATFQQCAAQLAHRPRTPDWQRIADQELFASLLHAVTTGWRQGWQPAELVRHVTREADTWHADLAADQIAAELHRYATATIDERWTARLAELGITPRPLEVGYLEHWGDRAGADRATTVATDRWPAFAMVLRPRRPDRSSGGRGSISRAACSPEAIHFGGGVSAAPDSAA